MSYNLRRPPHWKIKIPVTVRRDISKRSHEKIEDCEQSNDHPDDQSQPTFEMIPGFKPFTTAKIYIYYPPTSDQAFLFAHGTHIK